MKDIMTFLLELQCSPLIRMGIKRRSSQQCCLNEYSLRLLFHRKDNWDHDYFSKDQNRKRRALLMLFKVTFRQLG